MATDVSTFRLYVLRAMYAFIAVGLGLTIWPMIVTPPFNADAGSVVHALLGALAVLAALGIRYPLKMLPLLVFELIWKTIWVATAALPMWLSSGLDLYASETLFACLIGVVLVPIVIPWRFFYTHYIKVPGDYWRSG